MTAAPAAAPQPAPAVPDGSEPVLAPVDGSIKAIEDVPDDTFAAKILGDGFAVAPSSATIVAPVSGKVTTVANARHAVGITTDSGVEVLVHIGVDTVQLGGEPFAVRVAVGQTVTAGTPILDADWDAIKAAGKPTDVIVVFTNPALIKELAITAHGAVAAGTPVGTLR